MKTRIVTFFFACLAVCFVTLGCSSKKAESSSDEAQQEESVGNEAAQPAEESHGDHKDGEFQEGEGQEDQHEQAEDSSKQSAIRYHCPMKCGGDQTFAEAGNCPACGMELAMVQSAQ